MMFSRPDVIKAHLSNEAYGYPVRGARRRVEPTILAIVHITGNKRTASYDNPRQGTRAEIEYMDRRGSTGPTAHTYVSRDGALFQCVNAARFAAWSNGDLIVPDTSKPYVAEMVRKRGRYNPNELVFREYECTGHPAGKDINRKQLEAVAYQVAKDSIATGLPIRPFVTVGIHAHINTVNRRNCPFDSDRRAKIEALCERAREWKRHLKGVPDPSPDPGPTDPPDPVPPDEIVQLRHQLDAALGRIDEVTGERDGLQGVIEQVGGAIDPYFDFEEES